MIEIVVEGRGGQGGVTGAQIIAEAAFLSGKFKDVSSFPAFGVERRGAPVKSFTRISEKKIWTRTQIRNPNIVIILDPTVMSQATIDNIKENGIIIINTNKVPDEIESHFHFKIPRSKKLTVATVDVNKICFDVHLLLEGFPIVNTPILGALSKVLPDISLDSIKEAISSHMGGGEKAKLNVLAADFAAASTRIKKLE